MRYWWEEYGAGIAAFIAIVGMIAVLIWGMVLSSQEEQAKKIEQTRQMRDCLLKGGYPIKLPDDTIGCSSTEYKGPLEKVK